MNASGPSASIDSLRWSKSEANDDQAPPPSVILVRRIMAACARCYPAALNSVEAASLPWAILIFTGEAHDTPAWKTVDGFLKSSRLAHLESVLAKRKWLSRPFSLADILMADVLRRVDGLVNNTHEQVAAERAPTTIAQPICTNGALPRRLRRST